jgi:hypothetical protein
MCRMQSARATMFNRIKRITLCGFVLLCLEGCETMKWNPGSDNVAAQDDNRIPMYTNKGTVVSPSSATR